MEKAFNDHLDIKTACIELQDTSNRLKGFVTLPPKLQLYFCYCSARSGCETCLNHLSFISNAACYRPLSILQEDCRESQLCLSISATMRLAPFPFQLWSSVQLAFRGETCRLWHRRLLCSECFKWFVFALVIFRLIKLDDFRFNFLKVFSVAKLEKYPFRFFTSNRSCSTRISSDPGYYLY